MEDAATNDPGDGRIYQLGDWPGLMPASDPGARLEAVVDHTHARGFFPWRARWWKTGEFLIPFRADLDEPTWGLVMVELFAHLGDDDDFTADAVLRRALQKLPWSLFPGLQAVGSDGRIIISGCCSNLSGWRDWFAVLEGHMGEFGHDPLVTAELRGADVVIRSQMPLAPGETELVEAPDVIIIPRDRYRESLEELASELGAIAERVGTWGADLTDAATGAALADGFRASFGLPRA